MSIRPYTNNRLVEEGDGLPPLEACCSSTADLLSACAKRIGKSVSELFASPLESGIREVVRHIHIDNAAKEACIQQASMISEVVIGLRHVSSHAQWEQEAKKGLKKPGDAVNLMLRFFIHEGRGKEKAYIKAVKSFIKLSYLWDSAGSITPGETTVGEYLNVLNKTRFLYVCEYDAVPYEHHKYYNLGKFGRKKRPPECLRQIPPVTLEDLHLPYRFYGYVIRTEAESDILEKLLVKCTFKKMLETTDS